MTLLSNPGRRRRPSAQTQAEILAAAEFHFSEYGFAATSIAQLASVLSMSTTNIHKHFGSKRGLAEAVCGIQLDRFHLFIVEGMRGVAGTRTALQKFCQVVVRYNLEAPEKWPWLFELYVFSAEQDWTVFRHFRTQVVGLLEKIVAAGVETGELRKDAVADAESLFDSLQALMHPLLIRFDAPDIAARRATVLADFAYRALANGAV